MRSTDAAPLLQAEGLSKTYVLGEVQVQALREVNLSFREGEFVVLLGASGSGKSTLLNLLGGLDSPSTGRLKFRGACQDLHDEPSLTQFRRRSIGFVFQFYNLIPSLTALENVALVTEIADAPMTPQDALALVGLSARQHHFPAQLSGGEQQRVAIARAIAKRPAILLCDEPTGALDSATGVRVLEALRTVQRETGALALVITHNAVIADMADRVIYLSDGQVVREVANASPRAVATLSW